MLMRSNIKLGIDNSEFTKQCKLCGYTKKTVVKYIIENRHIVEDICERMLKSNDLREIIQYSYENRNWDKNGVIVELDCDYTLSDILNQFNIPTNAFIYFLTSHKLVKHICSELPEELKMKKAKQTK